jgi:hypothetical protein
MGRSSVDATKASLILWARAARRRRSAGLTYFFLPRGAVAERCVVVEVFLTAEEAGFLAVVVAEEAGFLADALLPGFLVLWVVEVVVSDGLVACASYRFPSAGETASRAHSTAASVRAGT